MNKCPRCAAAKRMHFACPECGWYSGRQVFVKRDRIKQEADDE